MATSKRIEQLKQRIDQLVIQRDHWKQLAENRNSIVVTEVCPDSRSVEEYIIDADSVRASWRLIRGYREQIEALRAECERLRVKLMAIASAEPARHGIEWAKAIAAEGNGEPYAKWREAIDERDALRAELAEVKGREAVSDADIEAAFARAGGFWDGDKWAIEDADLYPFARSIAIPPASLDVKGLVKALGRIHKQAVELECKQIPCSPEQREFADIARMADTALSTWRQAQEGKA